MILLLLLLIPVNSFYLGPYQHFPVQSWRSHPCHYPVWEDYSCLWHIGYLHPAPTVKQVIANKPTASTGGVSSSSPITEVTTIPTVTTESSTDSERPPAQR
ncbi:hypothetical protein Trydic_g13900 [Trypoxylus dichotomus]